MKNYKELKQQLLKDRQTHQAYKKRGPEFELIQLIIERRLKQGLTQAALAKKLNTKQSAISRLECSVSQPASQSAGRQVVYCSFLKLTNRVAIRAVFWYTINSIINAYDYG